MEQKIGELIRDTVAMWGFDLDLLSDDIDVLTAEIMVIIT